MRLCQFKGEKCSFKPCDNSRVFAKQLRMKLKQYHVTKEKIRVIRVQLTHGKMQVCMGPSLLYSLLTKQYVE